MRVSAVLLRKVDETLRERAKAAAPGPWLGADDGGVWRPTVPTRTVVEDGYVAGVNATYIATMHPGVGLALAEWLDAMGRMIYGTSKGDVPGEDYALAVARLIASEVL